MALRTKYAKSGELSIAYQVVGDGPIDLVHAPGFVSHLEYAWEEPGYARYLRRLATFSRLILFDKRGTGLSDRTDGIAPLEERMDDVRAVMDAANSERAVLFGVSESAPLACLFAATYPARTTSLVLYGAEATETRKPDYPWPPTEEEVETRIGELVATIHETWGAYGAKGGLNVDEMLAEMAPSAAGDPAFRTWFATFLRLAASPGAVTSLVRMNATIDVRHVLPAIRVPTLVLQREGVLGAEQSRYFAEHIPGARYIEVPGIDYFQFVGDSDLLIDEIEAFVTGTRPIIVPDHVLATVLVAEVANTVEEAVALGDRRWGDRQEQFRSLANGEITRFGGQLLELSGARVVATFERPSRAIHCAAAIGGASETLGLAIRAGLHTGECEERQERVSGVAISIAEWVAGQAAPDEILVSGTVKGLVSGADIRFADRGMRKFAGGSDDFPLFAVLTGPPVSEAVSATSAARIPLKPSLGGLTRREQEVLPLVAQGLSNLQIASILSISERTVESHVAGILSKWGLTTRTQIAAAASGRDVLPQY